MQVSTKSLLALLAGVLVAGAAQAQQGPAGFMLGIAGGLSKYNDSCEGLTRCDTSDRAVRFSAGYGLGNGLVVEAVSINFGKLKGSDGGISAELTSTATGGGVAFHLPVGGNLSGLFRLGLAQVKTKAKASGFGITINDSESQTAPYAGIGVAWKLTPNAALEAAWESTQLKYGGEKEAVSAATVGVSFRF